jgi:Cu/Ag efflux protein CusF
MKTLAWGLGLATAGMVLFTSQALAQGEMGSEQTSTKAETTATKTLQGKVEKFDRSENTLTLSGIDTKLKVDSSTQVMKEGARATLNDIKEGDQVRASYSGTGETVNAKTIDIMPSGSMGAPGTTEPSPGKTQSPSTGSSKPGAPPSY